MRRASTWIVVVSLMLSALVAGLLWTGFRSERGLRGLAQATQAFSGGRITIGSVQGRLLGESEFHDFRFTGDDGFEIIIRRVHLRLRPRELAAGRLHVELLEVEGFELQLSPNADSPQDSAEVSLPTALPLPLVVESMTLNGFDIRRMQAELFHLDRAELAGSWIGDRIDVARLATTHPQTGPLQATANARMSRDSIEFIELLLKGPGEIMAAGTLGLGTAKSDLKLQWRELRWPLVAVSEAPPELGAVHGEAHFAGPLDDYSYELSTEGMVRELPAKLTARGGGSLEQVHLEALRLQADKGSLRTQGDITWAPALRADLEVQFEQLNPGLFAADWNGVINGKLRTQTKSREGEIDIGFDLQIDRSTLRGQPLTLSARGSSGTRRARIEELLLRAGGGSVSAKGEIGWAPALTADLDARLDDINPGVFAPGWAGRVNGKLQVHTQPRNGLPDLNFIAKIDKSELRGYPLRLSASGNLYGEALTFEELSLSSGSTRLTAKGRATSPFDLAGKLDSPDLAALYPELAGRITLSFHLQGSLEYPQLVTHGEGTGLRYGTYRISKLDWDADIDPRKPSHLKVSASDADAGLKISSVKLSVEGVETYHSLKFDAITERGDLGITLEGGYDRKRYEWGGHLTSSRVAPTDLPPWAQQKSAGLLIGRVRQSLEPVCLSGDAGSACLRLEQNVTSQGLRLTWDLEHLHLGAFKPLLPADYEVQGEADGAGAIEIAGGDVASIDAQLRLSRASLQAPGMLAIEVLPSTLKADQVDGRLHAVLDLRLKQGTIGADVAAAPGANFGARALSGRMQMNVPDLAFVEQLLPELKSVGGKLEGALEFGGTAGLPRLRGSIALTEGHTRLSRAGIDLQQVHLRLTGDGAGPLTIDGAMRSGEGGLTLSGSVDPASTPPRVDLNLKGENFQAMAIPDARVWITPDLSLKSDDSGFHLGGSLTVPKADITPRKGVIGSEGVSASSDQVIVGAEPKTRGSALKLYSDMRVALGDAVNFKGYGLTTRLEGAVQLFEEPQRDTRAQGELRLVQGQYKAYGQDLNIETGRLIFEGGPVTQPALDFYATRRPQSDVTVGVRVRGTLNKPQLTMQSDPPMPREQQLSWLVLGRPLEQSSSADRSMVSQAALSLGLSGGDYVAQRLGKTVGLDQVSVGSAPISSSDVAADASAIQGSQASQNRGAYTYTTQAAQLTLGKYLTPKLFVSYGVSLFQPGQTFRLLYDLGRGFKLQTESGVASGGDLIYTFERGR